MKAVRLYAAIVLLAASPAGYCLAGDGSDEPSATYLHKLETESVTTLQKVLREQGGFRGPDATVAWEFHFQRDGEVSCWASFREIRSTGKPGVAGSSGSEAWHVFNLYYLDIFNLQHGRYRETIHGIQVSVPTVCAEPCVSSRDQYTWQLRPTGLEQSRTPDSLASTLKVEVADVDAARAFVDALSALAKTCGAQRKKDPYLPR